MSVVADLEELLMYSKAQKWIYLITGTLQTLRHQSQGLGPRVGP